MANISKQNLITALKSRLFQSQNKIKFQF